MNSALPEGVFGTAFGHILLGSHNVKVGHGSWLVCEVALINN